MQHHSFGLHKSILNAYSDQIVDENKVPKPIKIELLAYLEKLDIELSKTKMNFGNILPHENKTFKETFIAKNKSVQNKQQNPMNLLLTIRKILISLDNKAWKPYLQYNTCTNKL